MPCRSSLNAMACLFQGIIVGLGALTVMELGAPLRTKASVPDSFEQRFSLMICSSLCRLHGNGSDPNSAFRSGRSTSRRLAAVHP